MRGPGVLVAQTQGQAYSGLDTPIILNEASVPVSPLVLSIRLRGTQQNRPIVRKALEVILQGRKNNVTLGQAERGPVKHDVKIFEAKLESVLAMQIGDALHEIHVTFRPPGTCSIADP